MLGLPTRRRAGWAVAVGVLVALGPAGPAAAAPAPPPVSLSDVQVADGHISTVLTVRAGDRQVRVDPGSITARVNGVPVPVTVAPVTQEQRTCILVVDTSGSMGASGMATVLKAASAFLDTVPGDVEVGLVAFSDVPRVVVAPTLDRAVVRRAVSALKSHGETTLYDALLTTIGQLGGAGDRSFILLSDGGDTRSSHTLADVTARLTASGVRAEVVGFKTDETQTSVLSTLASSAHGSVAAAGDAAAVASAFRAAARALDSQVRIVVAAPAGSGLSQLSVSARAGGVPVEAITAVSLTAATPSAAPTPSAPAAQTRRVASGQHAAPATARLLGLPLLLVVSLGAIFLGLTVLVLALLSPMFRSERDKRVRAIEQYVNNPDRARGARGSSSPSSLSANLVELGDRVMEGRSSTSRTVTLLERADLPLRAGEWAVLRVVAVVIGLAVGLLFIHGGLVADLIGGVVGGLVGLVGPSFFLRFSARRRARKFETQLPEVLTLVASSLSTGFSLLQGLDAVARDAADPAAKEFSRALAETRIGADIDDSIERMAERMDSTNLRWTGMAIRIQRQVGGNLAETLKTTAATLREREALHRHVRALSAEGRLSAYILIGLPIGIFLYMLQVNHDYIALLWSNLIGIGMLVSGVVSLGLGILWMRKVVEVEV